MVIYENKHSHNKSIGPYEILENKFKKELADISDAILNENLYKFNRKPTKPSNNELPGKFGIPHPSITPTQVCFINDNQINT